MNEEYSDLIESARVSPQTRKVLMARTEGATILPSVLTEGELGTLRSLLARVVPQRETANQEIDLAGGIDRELAAGRGDGWRYASLPSDLEACRHGLRLLDEFARKLSAVPFEQLEVGAQDGLLDAIATGRLHSSRLDLKRWFEDMRAMATQIYISHPETLARMAYSGIADEPNGFVSIGIGEVERWEPNRDECL